MLNKVKPKSEFSRNVLTLMTGTTIAQAIPIAISPILTRIYTPEDFGVLALFVAITSIFGSIANGRYELAIMLPKKDEDAINIFALGFIITVVLSLMILFAVVIFNDYLTNILNNKEISNWLYAIPFSVFFIGMFNILNYFNNRKKYYRDIAKTIIIKSILSAIIQVSIGSFKSGATGLISGQIFSQIFANMHLLKNIIKDKPLISKISKVKIIALAKKYRDFPKFSMWAGLANTSSTHLSNIFISLLYSTTTLGFYSFTQRLLGLPSSLIASSVGKVFFQAAVEEKNKTGTSIIIFKSTVKKLIVIGLPSFVFLYFIVEDLFTFVFGEEWRIAGGYAKILMPLLLIQFIVSPVTAINQVYLKNKNVMFWQVGLITLYSILIFTSDIMSLSFSEYLRLVSLFVSAYYLYHLFLLYSYIQKGNQSE